MPGAGQGEVSSCDLVSLSLATVVSLVAAKQNLHKSHSNLALFSFIQN